MKIKSYQAKLKIELKSLIEQRLKTNGLRMTKKISSGGLFSNSTWDNRTVCSFNDLFNLNKEGFKIDEDLGAFLLNCLVI